MFRQALLGAFVAVLALSGCGQQAAAPRSVDQQAVVETAQKWARAISNDDFEGAFALFSKRAKQFYADELGGPGGARARVRAQSELVNSAHAPREEKERAVEYLRSMPSSVEIERMTPGGWYAFKTRKTATRENKDYNLWLVGDENVREAVVDRDRATLIFKDGKPERMQFVREDGAWKLDLSEPPPKN